MELLILSYSLIFYSRIVLEKKKKNVIFTVDESLWNKGKKNHKNKEVLYTEILAALWTGKVANEGEFIAQLSNTNVSV